MRLLPAQIALLSVLYLAGGVVHAERSVVLVTNRSCPMDSISMLDIRKAYLAITVSFDGNPVRAFRQAGDAQLNKIFYQSVVAMSKKTYERRLLSMVLKFGSPRPGIVRDRDELLAALKSSRCGISYLWENDASLYPDIKSIRLLWQGD